MARWIWAALLIAGAGPLPAGAAPAPTENDVKAVYLVRFVEYVDWGDAEDRPLRIGVLGENPFGTALREAAGSSRLRRPLEVHYVQEVTDLLGCDVVFAGEGAGDLAEIAKAARNKPVLLVSDVTGALAQGFHLEFRRERASVRFAANPQAAVAQGLRLRSQLLAAAVEVVSLPRDSGRGALP